VSTEEYTSPRGAAVIDQVTETASSWRYALQLVSAAAGPTLLQRSSTG
jgi:hypothetical protein